VKQSRIFDEINAFRFPAAGRFAAFLVILGGENDWSTEGNDINIMLICVLTIDNIYQICYAPVDCVSSRRGPATAGTSSMRGAGRPLPGAASEVKLRKGASKKLSHVLKNCRLTAAPDATKYAAVRGSGENWDFNRRRQPKTRALRVLNFPLRFRP
jgi:hypothetical protein